MTMPKLPKFRIEILFTGEQYFWEMEAESESAHFGISMPGMVNTEAEALAAARKFMSDFGLEEETE